MIFTMYIDYTMYIYIIHTVCVDVPRIPTWLHWALPVAGGVTVRPPSPPPVYDKGGNRLNTRDVRIRRGYRVPQSSTESLLSRKAMTAEYNRLIRPDFGTMFCKWFVYVCYVCLSWRSGT